MTAGVAVIDVADFFEDEDMNAAGAARTSEKGTVDGAVNLVSTDGGEGAVWLTSQRSRRHGPRQGHHLFDCNGNKST